MASKNPQARAIEKEAKRLSLADDGKTSHAERFAIRARLREEAGMGKEQRVRGGLARIYDANKQYALPLAALAAPFVLPAIGSALGIGGAAGAGGAAAGAAGGAAAGSGAISAIPAIGGIGGVLKKGVDFLGSDTARSAMGVIGALDATRQRNRANDLTNDAVARDTGRWDANAPLRDAGMAALLNPSAPNTGNLAALQSRGNPFAIPAMPSPMATPPAPVSGPMPTSDTGAPAQGQVPVGPARRAGPRAVPAVRRAY